MSTVFATPINNVSTKLSLAYTAGSGSLTVTNGGLFPALSGGNFYRVTVMTAAYAYSPTMTSLNYTIYPVTGVAGNVLTIGSPLESTSDRNYQLGDIVEIRVTAGTISDLSQAIGSVNIGASVSGGTANRVLYEGAGPVVANSSGLIYDGTTFIVGGSTGITSAMITSSATGFGIQQTGDTFGASSITLTNRNGSNGAIFLNSTLDLVDFGFKTSTAAQTNIRYEHRSLYFNDPGNISGEFQFLYPADPILPTALVSFGLASFVVGPVSVGYTTGTPVRFGVGTTAAPGANVDVANYATGDVGLRITGRGAATGDLTQWRSSAPSVLSSVDANGVICMATQSTTGTPAGTSHAGGLIFDTANNKLWVWNGSAWKFVTLS